MAFKVALIQMRVVGGNKPENLRHARDMMAEAAGQGAAILVLPEAMDLGWTHPASRTEAEPVPGGMPYRVLAEAAVRHGVLVCSGLTEAEEGRVFNSAVLIDRRGNLLCKHRKLNELAVGHDLYDQGDRLGVARTELGTLGLMICADGFAKDHVLSRSLGYMGAGVILSPCAWAVAGDHDNTQEPYGDTWRNAYMPVAREFAMWIAGVSNVGAIAAGPWAGRKCIGCSLVIGPDGQEVLQGPYGVDAETILYVDVQPGERPARGGDWEEHWRIEASKKA
jgi:predicted amidohydrolase